MAFECCRIFFLKVGKFQNRFSVQLPLSFLKKIKKVGTYAIKCVAAGVHLPTPWLFESAKRPDNIADYCLGCSFLS